MACRGPGGFVRRSVLYVGPKPRSSIVYISDGVWPSFLSAVVTVAKLPPLENLAAAVQFSAGGVAGRRRM
jgi:hypothetical protein